MSRSVLEDVANSYTAARRAYDQAAGRGDSDAMDEALAAMQTIERCVTVHETSTAWRTAISLRSVLPRRRSDGGGR